MRVQAAKTKQAIKEEEMQITVIERAQNIQVQEQEIIRRERELDATIRKPAEAEKYRLEKIADANKYEIICSVYYRRGCRCCQPWLPLLSAAAAVAVQTRPQFGDCLFLLLPALY